MPLGAAEITLEESTSVYGGLVSGTAWSFPGQAEGRPVASPAASALLIAEIRDVDGKVLYQVQPEPRQIAQAGTPDLTAHILRNVVTRGTGRRALALTEGGRQLPVGGKTGTTNEFRNAAFLGFVPVWTDEAYEAVEGYTLGVYVGYDDNRPLVQGRIRLAGSSGALPTWVSTIEGLNAAGLLGTPEQVTGMADDDPLPYWPLSQADGLEQVQVSAVTGLALEEPGAYAAGDPIVLVPERIEPAVDYAPRQRPPRLFLRTEQFKLQELEEERPQGPLFRRRDLGVDEAEL
jgi:membrane peptidoglycan carboxypeptidase